MKRQQEEHKTPKQREVEAAQDLIDIINNGGSEEEIEKAKRNYQKAEQQKKEFENDLDDFYDRQDDGFGGQ